MRRQILTIVAIFLFSCSDNEDQIKKLTAENEIIQGKIDSLQLECEKEIEFNCPSRLMLNIDEKNIEDLIKCDSIQDIYDMQIFIQRTKREVNERKIELLSK